MEHIASLISKDTQQTVAQQQGRRVGKYCCTPVLGDDGSRVSTSMDGLPSNGGYTERCVDAVGLRVCGCQNG